MDPHKGRRFGTDCSFIVPFVGTVSGTHFHETRPALSHHIGNAKASANLYKLPPGDHNLPVAGQSRQNKQNSTGVVVHHQCSLSSRETLQKRFSMNIARASASFLQIILQTAVTSGGILHRLPGPSTQRGPPQVGMNDDTRSIDNRPQGGPGPLPQQRTHLSDQLSFLWTTSPRYDCITSQHQSLANGLHNQIVSKIGRQASNFCKLKEMIDAGQIS